MQAIYLDHNATTSLSAAAAAAMAECRSSAWANPESQHQLGRRARRALEDAREGIAENLGVNLSGPRPDRIIFTSGGTEANNLALLGMTAGNDSHRVVISSIEHPSVAAPAQALARRGWQLDRLPVSKKGDVLLFSPEGSIEPGRPQQSRMSLFLLSPFSLASVMLANNETGVIQPIRELADACKAAGLLLHTDAVQAVGKIPVNFRELSVAAMTIAAHKFGGPRGVGALIIRGDTPIQPQLFGGVQQDGFRPGTEPVVLAAGMHAALRAFDREQNDRIDRITRLRDRLETALLDAWPSAAIHGAGAPRLPNTTCVAFPGLDRQALVMALDLAGVCCSTGSACASGSSEPSPTLLAMGLPDELVASSVRFSLGATTTIEMIDEAVQRITRVLQSQRQLHQGQPAKTATPGAVS
jgi:cysteine desulfurase